jgi:hypothetical protein
MNEYTIDVTETFKVQAGSREEAVALLVAHDLSHPQIEWIDTKREVIDENIVDVEIRRVVQIDSRTSITDKCELLDAAVDRGDGVKVTVQMDMFEPERELLGVIYHHRSRDRYRVGGHVGGTVFRANHVRRMELI